MALKLGKTFPVLGLAAAGWMIGGLGLRRAYRHTLRFYQGAEEGGAAAAPAPVPRPGQLLVERRLPWLSEEVGALTLANLRSLLRAPELKMMLLTPLIFCVIMPSVFLTRRGAGVPPAMAAFAASGAVFFAVFTSAPSMANIFGLDRNGFRTWVLLPTARRHILLAKNLAFLPFTLLVGLVFLLVAGILMRPPLTALLTGLVQIPTAFLLFVLVGNTTSILMPYRVAPGTLKAAKPRGLVFLAMLANVLLTPLVMVPVLIPAGLQLLCDALGWLPWLPVNLLTALVLCAGAVGLYRGVLPSQGRLLQKREQIILREVTEEVE
jgi:hypothetical protein